MKFTLMMITLWCVSAGAQTAKLNIVNGTPEGAALTQIGQEQDPAAKLKLLEEFSAKYPKDPSSAWVYSQMEAAYVKESQFDKAIDAGEKGLAAQPDDAVIAYNLLKAAEGKNDADLIAKYAGQTSDIARKTVQSPQPPSPDETEAWKLRVDFAKQADNYTEYALFAAASRSKDPKKTILLVDTLMTRAPESKYLRQAYGSYFSALRQAGMSEKAGPMAEAALAKDPNNDELLLVVADYYAQKKTSPDKVIDYSDRLVQAVNGKPKPENISDADWEKRKSATLGLGYWMAGLAANEKGNMALVDKDLRAALPYVQVNDQLLSSTLFYLGVANYQIGHKAKNRAQMTEAQKFSEKAAAMESPFKQAAAKNVASIKAELARPATAQKR